MGIWPWRPPYYRRSIICNLKSGETLSGVLLTTRGPWYVLSRSALLQAGQAPTSIDGDAVIHRENIAFTQVLPEAIR
jgi:hypothetical protein